MTESSTLRLSIQAVEVSGNIELFADLIPIMIDALEAAMPHCLAAQIPVKYGDAYDEWETLKQQFFNSFVIMGTEDGDTMSPHRYGKLGFAFPTRNSKVYFAADIDNVSYVLRDILSTDGKTIVTAWSQLDEERYQENLDIDKGQLQRLKNIRTVQLIVEGGKVLHD